MSSLGKVLYIDYKMYGKEDIMEAFEHEGYHVELCDAPLRYGETSEETRQAICAQMEKTQYDIVFTSNYYPMVSNLCEQFGVIYISWTYDSPSIALHDRSIVNSCNYAFTFDSDECDHLRSLGVKTVYYMPLGVNPDRIQKLEISDRDRELFSAEVSLVASLYNEEHNLYDRMAERLDPYTKGYLEGAMYAQKNLFGGFVLGEVLKNEEVLRSMYQAMPYENGNSLADPGFVYANYFLARKTASMQRLEYIREISRRHEMKVYTPGDLSGISTVCHMGTVDYQTDMYRVFQLSRINLNVTLPSIHTGIPLRAMDIMGAGGFLLTNYQNDFMELFEPDREFVYFTSLEDALYKIAYYLEHEDERAQIAQNAREKMWSEFTYEKQVQRMLGVVYSR